MTISKEVGSDGVTRKVVPWVRAKTRLRERYRNVGDFNLTRWMRRFKDARTSHEERLGMLRGIPETLSPQEWTLVLRNVILDWADGLSDAAHSMKGEPHSVRKKSDLLLSVQKEAMLVLLRFFDRMNRAASARLAASVQLEEYVLIRGFYDDIVTFFKPDPVAARTVQNLSNPFEYLAPQGHPLSMAGEGATDVMRKFIGNLFSAIWASDALKAGHDDDSDRAKSLARIKKWEAFTDLARIDHSLIDRLPLDKAELDMLAEMICRRTECASLDQVAGHVSDASSFEPDWRAVSLELRVLAVRNSWPLP